MNFFSDHDVFGQTIKFLREKKHNVIRAQDIGLAESKDSKLLDYASHHELILVTRDKDFGSLVFQQKAPTAGVIFLRTHPFTISAVHKQLDRVLTELSDEQIRQSFIVVEASHYRVRKIP